jgi:anti-sigma factor RsiW
MTDHQTPLSDDELLSAYLDGELAGDDLARAERLLAEQPGSRQLLDDLRTIRDGLRALPGGQLGEGFPQRVLRKAERQLLTESQVSATSPAAHSPARWRNKRPWIYAAASLAAGLLIAVVSWPQRSMKAPASAADQPAADKFAHHAPASSSPASMYPAAAAKPTIVPAPPENQTGLQAALAQWGFNSQDANEIVDQLSASQKHEQPASETPPLIVWSLAVSPDALEHEGLERVLVRNELRVVEQLPLRGETTLAVDAASATRPAVKLSVAGASAIHPPVMAVLATGSPQQLDATLADLRSRSDTFQQVTNLGRQSLPAAGRTAKRKSSLALQPAQASGGQGQAKDQAPTEAKNAPRSRSLGEVQGPAEMVLFILRRAEPTSPATTSESGKAAKPAADKD